MRDAAWPGRKRTTCRISALTNVIGGWDFPATISWMACPGVGSSCVKPRRIEQDQGQPLVGRDAPGEPERVSHLDRTPPPIQPNSASDAPVPAPRVAQRAGRIDQPARQRERIDQKWRDRLLQAQPDTGSLNRIRTGQLPAQRNHCGAAQVRACTPL